MKKMILLLIMLAVLASFAYADALRPGYKNIGVSNVITNINDFPDYVFITVGQLPPSMCPVQTIGSDGEIPPGYKFCGISVYAVKKSDFDENFIADVEQTFEQANEEARLQDPSINPEKVTKEYLSSRGAKEVIKDIITLKEVPITSTQESFTNSYTIDLEGVKEKPGEEPKKTIVEPGEEPAKIVVERDYLFYVYITVMIIALAVIVFLVFKKKRIK